MHCKSNTMLKQVFSWIRVTLAVCNNQITEFQLRQYLNIKGSMLGALYRVVTSFESARAQNMLFLYFRKYLFTLFAS